MSEPVRVPGTIEVTVHVPVTVTLRGELVEGVFRASDETYDGVEAPEVERRDIMIALYEKLDGETITFVPDKFDEATNPTVEVQAVHYDNDTYTHGETP